MKRTHDRGKRLLLLLLAAAMLAAVSLAAAEQEAVSPYRIVLTAPGGWSGSNSAAVRVSITDRDSIGWYRIEYRMNDKGWFDCEDLFEQNQAEITVHENGTFALRITDPHGHTFEETVEINTIDVTAPSVTAEIRDMTLHMTVQDDLSGIAGLQVNSMLFTTVDGGVLDVEMDQNMNRFERLAIRAFDFAGNFTDPVTLDNPCYEKPADSTPQATAAATAGPTLSSKAFGIM